MFAFRRTKARLGQAEVLDPAEAGLDTPKGLSLGLSASAPTTSDSHTVRQFDRLTDNQGRTVSFRNAILIMTSNIGASLIAETSRSITAEMRR